MKKIFKDWRSFLTAHKNNPNVASLLSEQINEINLQTLQRILDGPPLVIDDSAITKSRPSNPWKTANRQLAKLTHGDGMVPRLDALDDVKSSISQRIRFFRKNINNSNLHKLFRESDKTFGKFLEDTVEATLKEVDKLGSQLGPEDRKFFEETSEILKKFAGHLDGTKPIPSLTPPPSAARPTGTRSTTRPRTTTRYADIGRSSPVAAADSARARSATAPEWERVGPRANAEDYARAAANNRAAASAAANAAELGDEAVRAATGAADDVTKAASAASPITKAGLKPNAMASRYKSMSKGVIKGLAGYGIKGAKGGIKIIGGVLGALAWPLTIFDPFASEAHAATLPTKQKLIKNALVDKYPWVYAFFNSIDDNYMYRHFEVCFSAAYVTDYDVPGSINTSRGPIIVALVDDETGWSRLQRKYPQTYKILEHVVKEINRNHKEDLRRKRAAEKIKADQERIYRKYPDVSPASMQRDIKMGLYESNKKKKP